MTAATLPKNASSLTAGRLPGWAPWAILLAALVVGSAVSLLLSGRVSIPGTLVIGLLLFLIAQYAIAFSYEGRRKATDRTVTALVIGAFGLALLPLISLIIEVLIQGTKRMDALFFTSSMRNVTGEMLGGAAHAISGTLIITGIATLISVPIGLLTAVYLVEYGRGRLARAITFFVDVMTGIPSIVAGLFAFTLFATLLGSPGYKSGLSGAVALSVLMIPVVVRSTEELLRLVPNELREAAYALGVPKWRTIVKVVIPTALSGIVSGVIIAIARVIGETAPLLIAASYSQSQNLNPLDNPMMTLPVFVYNSYANPGLQGQLSLDRAFAGALTLILIVMLLNLIGRVIAAKFAPKTGR